MEKDMGHLGVDTLSHTSPPFFQHQFFPGAGGMQSMHPNHGEHSLSSTNWDLNSVQGGVCPPHWDMKAWTWDNVRFLAQPTAEMGGNSGEGIRSHISTENAVSHRASEGFRLDRPSGTEQQGNHNEEDDSEQRGRSFFGRETPSPPLNERRSFPRDVDSPEEVGSLSLKLGGDSYAYTEENGNGSRNGKRNRSSSPQSQIATCQVDACKADLSKAKDYHRRHKVCEMHSKAAKAPVSRLMQRFCQQCSRFHPLQEFDEGKRSCRRRLAGHNRRRRKTQPDAAAARAYLLAEEERLGKGGTGLIGSLLNILGQLTGSASLDRLNNPVLDREALLRKAVAASLEDVNRTTPLWNQLLPNTYHLTSGLGQRLDQAATTSGPGADLAMETQRLLSRLAGPSPEALLLLLQSSLSAQIAAASLTTQNNSLPHMNGGSGSGNVPLGSSCGPEAVGTYAGTLQTGVAPPNTGVSHSMLGRASLNSEVVRPTPTAPAGLPQMNPEQSARQGYPGLAPSVQRMFPPNSAVVNQSLMNERLNHGRDAAAGGQPSIDGRASSMLPFLGHRELQCLSKGALPSARPDINLQQHPVEQFSDNSQSGSDEQSPTSSNAHIEWRNRTRRISFKLFERTPEELPSNLRLQIDSWLAHLPSDMESYIRPGCLVLTIFVSMPTRGWMELDRDLQGSVKKLLNLCSDDFWHKGRILVQVERQTVLIVDGDIEETRYLESWGHPYIQSVRPLAVEAGQSTTISIKGVNLTLSDTRILCAHQGKYLLQEGSNEEHTQADNSHESDEDDEVADDNIAASADCTALARNDETSLRLDQEFTLCGEPFSAVGRCFLEVEHHMSAANTRPVIVADRFMCSELRKLEEEIELAASRTARAAALEGLEPVEVLGCSEVARLIVEEDIACFLHELGWFFQSSSYWRQEDPSSIATVPALQLKCLLIFSVERSWCAVVRKLLDIALGHKNIHAAVARLSHVLQDEVSLLHRAVRQKNRPMVELLLGYVPPFSTESAVNPENMEDFGKLMQFKLQWGNIFRPDMAGPAGLTPLHIAAILQDAEDVVDALTGDPYRVGLHTWVNKRDDSGQTPLDFAMAGKNLRSVQLVRDKLARLGDPAQEVCISMPFGPLPQTWYQGPSGGSQSEVGSSSAVQLAVWVDKGSVPAKNPGTTKVAPTTCRVRPRRPNHFGGITGPAFKPFLLSLVAIAAVCVCICIVFKGPPQVRFVLPPFRWEGVDGGPK